MTRKNIFAELITTAGIAAMLSGGSLFAGEYGKAPIDAPPPVESDDLWNFCNLFDYATLYDGDGFIKKVKFIGRYHGQFVESQTESNPAGTDTGDRFWDHRRWRAGLQIGLANNLTFSNTYNLDNSREFRGNRFIESVEEMVLEWEPNDDFYVILGKQKPKITREYATSSKRILTFERSTIVNNVVSDKLWGAAVGFAALGTTHEVGLFANAYENDWRWPSFDDAGAVATYRASRGINDSTSAHFDYQYADTNYTGAESYASSPYQHVFALGTESQWGRFGLVLDAIGAYDRGDGRLSAGDDSHGIVVLPSYDITDKLQFVTKYAYASDARITHPQRRAGSRPDVDGLHTIYGGLTYRLCEDKLKLMAGYEYADAKRVVGSTNDYSNGTWLFGVRTYW